MSYTIETASPSESTKATTTTTGEPAVTPAGTSGAAGTVTAATTGELSSQPTPDGNVDLLQCTISPQRGSVFDTFNFTCNTRVPCPKCQYCFTTTEGNLDRIILHENLSNLTKNCVNNQHLCVFKNVQGSICAAVTKIE